LDEALDPGFCDTWLRRLPHGKERHANTIAIWQRNGERCRVAGVTCCRCKVKPCPERPGHARGYPGASIGHRGFILNLEEPTRPNTATLGFVQDQHPDCRSAANQKAATVVSVPGEFIMREGSMFIRGKYGSSVI
jgi:hypothetical protein